MTRAAVLEAVSGAEAMPLPKGLRVLSVHQLLAMSIPPREMLLEPILQKQGLLMLHFKRGVGKTHVVLGIAYALASGGSFLRWKAARPTRVLIVDGEMPLSALQERLAAVVAAGAQEPPAPDYLQLVASDYQPNGLPDLATPEGQAALEPLLTAGGGVEVLILDNLSTLCRSGKENEGEGWLPVQEWALSLRRRGISVVFVHHAGKGGAQRGTSRREDVLDTVIALRHAETYSPDQGAVFEVHLEKARAVHGEPAKPFEAKLEVREGAAVWTTRDLTDSQYAAVVALLQDRLSVRDTAEELGIGKSTVSRMRQRAIAEGLIDA